MPEISVVIPSHNVVSYIDEALRSVRAAVEVDLEIIVVDDASTDGTFELATRHATVDPRVKVFRSPGKGGGAARNFGVTQASGEYLAFCDGDDFVGPDAYRKMLAAAREHRVDMVVGGYLKLFTDRTWDARRYYRYLEPISRTTLQETPHLITNRSCWNRLYTRTFWDSLHVEFPTVLRSNDIVPMVTALLAATSISVLSDVVYIYRGRTGTGSMTAKRGDAAAMASYLSQEQRCAALVAEREDAGITQSFWKMFLARDGYDHLLQYLERFDATQTVANQEVQERLAAMLAAAPPHIWKKLAEEKKTLFSLVAERKAEKAAAMGAPQPAQPGSMKSVWRSFKRMALWMKKRI